MFQPSSKSCLFHSSPSYPKFDIECMKLLRIMYHTPCKGRVYFNMFLLHNSILRRTISYYTSGKHYAIAATPTSILSESLGEICLVAICHKKVEWDEDEINHRAFIAKWNYLLFPKNQQTFFSPGPIVILFVLGKTSSQQMHNSKSAELSGSMQKL